MRFERNMSYGYLVITSRPCPFVTQIRGEHFSFIGKLSGHHLYFRFCESVHYTKRDGQSHAVLTETGAAFLRQIHHENQGDFLFADVLLQHKEGEADTAALILQQALNGEVPVIYPQKDLRIHLRKAYRVRIGDKNG